MHLYKDYLRPPQYIHLGYELVRRFRVYKITIQKDGRVADLELAGHPPGFSTDWLVLVLVLVVLV